MKAQSSEIQFAGESRIHVGLAVQDLEKSRQFYEILLGVPASKKRAGYVKFEPADPSLNLSLNESENAPVATGFPVHYGIQLKSSTAVEAAADRLESAGIDVKREGGTTCCYAVQDKVWATDPDGNPWEIFVVLDSDADQRQSDDGTCCADDCCPGDESKNAA